MIEIIDCEQNTPEWFAARSGIPTASEYSTILAEGRKKGTPSITRQKYLYRLLGERLTGEMEEGYTNATLERGHVMEPEAADMYAFMTSTDPQVIGFIRNGEKGCSPDRLIGEDGMLQIKTAKPSVLLSILEAGGTDDHLIQCQGEIWTAEREWNDLFIYWPGLPPFMKRYYRDEEVIKRISDGVDKFLDELHDLEEKYRKAV